MRNFLERVRKLPEKKRKLILWFITIIIGLFLIFFWAGNIKNKLSNFPKKEFIKKLDMPNLEMPKIEFPKISEEELKKLQEENLDN